MGGAEMNDEQMKQMALLTKEKVKDAWKFSL